MATTKKVLWKLKQGNKFGQQTSEEKRVEGMAYIQRLRDAGENILEIEETADAILITMEDK
jgi:hypothetical protein